MESLIAAAKPILAFIAAADYTGIILLISIIVFGVMMYRLNQSESTKFFYDQLFVDSDGKASSSKLAQLTALFISTWAFVHLTLKGTLSEWYFFGYMTIWVLQRGYSKWIDLQKDINKESK